MFYSTSIAAYRGESGHNMNVPNALALYFLIPHKESNICTMEAVRGNITSKYT